MPLKYTCPQCGKLHRNIDKRLFGEKVQCACGKVIRLGGSRPAASPPTASPPAPSQSSAAGSTAAQPNAQRITASDSAKKITDRSKTKKPTVASAKADTSDRKLDSSSSRKSDRSKRTAPSRRPIQLDATRPSALPQIDSVTDQQPDNAIQPVPAQKSESAKAPGSTPQKQPPNRKRQNEDDPPSAEPTPAKISLPMDLRTKGKKFSSRDTLRDSADVFPILKTEEEREVEDLIAFDDQKPQPEVEDLVVLDDVQPAQQVDDLIAIDDVKPVATIGSADINKSSPFEIIDDDESFEVIEDSEIIELGPADLAPVQPQNISTPPPHVSAPQAGSGTTSQYGSEILNPPMGSAAPVNKNTGSVAVGATQAATLQQPQQPVRVGSRFQHFGPPPPPIYPAEPPVSDAGKAAMPSVVAGGTSPILLVTCIVSLIFGAWLVYQSGNAASDFGFVRHFATSATIVWLLYGLRMLAAGFLYSHPDLRSSPR